MNGEESFSRCGYEKGYEFCVNIARDEIVVIGYELLYTSFATEKQIFLEITNELRSRLFLHQKLS